MDGWKEAKQRDDWILRCLDCSQKFIFTVAEQDFYAAKQLSTPKRCKPCRKVRRQTIVPDKGAWRD